MFESLAAWYSEPGVDLYMGDCREVMAGLPADSVDCVVFSPPFFGLRKYDGVQELVWGGEDGCEHKWQDSSWRNSNSSGGWQGGSHSGLEGGLPKGEQVADYKSREIPGATCSLCGAWRGAWGLEPSVELWVAHTVEVMQAVKRVLKDTGICFLEVGDSYFSGDKWGGQRWQTISGSGNLRGYPEDGMPTQHTKHDVLKPKDLCLVPERLALALQQAGWWVRSRIVWARPNPMPESVTDRPTKSHSTIWMLTKAADYYFDQEAVREPHSRDWGSESSQGSLKPGSKYTIEAAMPTAHPRHNSPPQMNPSGRNVRDVWTFPTSPFGYELCQSCGQIYTAAQYGRLPQAKHLPEVHQEGYEWHFRGPSYLEGRSTEEVSPVGVSKLCRCGASDFLSHFATFPEALPTRCILASTSEAGCCPKCGKSWKRKVGKASQYESHGVNNAADLARGRHGANSVFATGIVPIMQTLGWAPTCKCDLPQAENVPATVLDVCSGSGTTVLAAKKLGRRAVGVDLSYHYLQLAKRRIQEIPQSMSLGRVSGWHDDNTAQGLPQEDGLHAG